MVTDVNDAKEKGDDALRKRELATEAAILKLTTELEQVKLEKSKLEGICSAYKEMLSAR